MFKGIVIVLGSIIAIMLTMKAMGISEKSHDESKEFLDEVQGKNIVDDSERYDQPKYIRQVVYVNQNGTAQQQFVEGNESGINKAVTTVPTVVDEKGNPVSYQAQPGAYQGQPVIIMNATQRDENNKRKGGSYTNRADRFDDSFEEEWNNF